MITPAEVLGLSGATLESRVRQALRHMSEAELGRVAARLSADALRNGVTYDHGGVAEPVRIMLRPLLIMPEQLAYIHHTCEKILDALKRLPTMYLTDPRVRQVLRISEEEEAWLREAWSPTHESLNPIYGRLDAVCDFAQPGWRESLQFLEPNLVGVGGINFGPVAEQLMMRDVVPAMLTHDPGLVIELPPDQRELFLQLLLDHAQAVGRPGRNLCLVDPKYESGGANEQPGLAQFCRERHGVSVVHADPRELRVVGDEVYLRDLCIDVVYRDYETRDLIGLAKSHRQGLAAMRLLFKQNRVVSSLGGDFDHKSCWEVLTDDTLTAACFTPEERRLFHRHLLWTRVVSERRTTLPRGEGDLVEYVRRHRDQLVLKPNRGSGGTGVYLGAHVSESDWEVLIQRALKLAEDPNDHWVVQAAASVPCAEFPVIDEKGRVHEEPFFVVQGFAPTDGGLGLLCRVSQKQIVNVTQRGGMAAVLIGHAPSELRTPRRRTGRGPDMEARLRRRISDLRALDASLSLLGWDEETCLPKEAHTDRGAQTATIESLRHRLLVDEELGDLVEEVAAQAPPGSRLGAELSRLRRLRAIALAQPDDLVRAFARARSRSLPAWAQARARDDFANFLPVFSELVGLVRERAEALRRSGDLYDGLLDEHEPGMTKAQLDPLFAGLEEKLIPLSRHLAARTGSVRAGVLSGHYPDPAQDRFCRKLLQDMGFDFARGRVDRSEHPCTALMGDADVRVTLRLSEGDLLNGIFVTLHEGGHALYDQGFDPALKGTLLAEAPGLGIHESQARLWENHVGRSRAFWERYLPELRSLFPPLLQAATPHGVYCEVNLVRPGPVRVEADEVTYDLHILLRYRLELSLLEGSLAVGDLPAAWADESKRLLGVRPAGGRDGCLQDIHWGVGCFGQFPCYTLGNLFAAQLMEAFLVAHPAFEADLLAGSFSPLLGWLRENVHAHGHTLSAGEIIERATGRPLDTEAFFRTLARKHA